MRTLSAIAVALVLFGGVSCSAVEPKDLTTGPPTLSGPVLEVANQGDRLVIQAYPPDRSSGRVWIEVIRATTLHNRSGERVTKASIRPGDAIEVWTTYPMLRSDPGQTTAEAIVVDPLAP